MHHMHEDSPASMLGKKVGWHRIVMLLYQHSFTVLNREQTLIEKNTVP